jgi:hypothetical protein
VWTTGEWNSDRRLTAPTGPHITASFHIGVPGRYPAFGVIVCLLYCRNATMPWLGQVFPASSGEHGKDTPNHLGRPGLHGDQPDLRSDRELLLPEVFHEERFGATISQLRTGLVAAVPHFRANP